MRSTIPELGRRFVGRAEELRALRAVKHDLASGRGGIALIGGTAGIGKSRLLAEFLQTVDGGRAPLVVRTECLEYGGTTFGPIREIVAKVAASDGGRIDAAATASLERGSFFAAIEAIVREAARKRAIVVSIEDLHWADRSTLEFIAYWAAHIASTRVAAFVTYRDDELEMRPEANALLAGIARVGASRAIALRPLDDASIQQLLDGGPHARPAARLMHGVLERAGGNPFFAEELYKAALETNSGDALPQSISASILVRFRGLDEADRAVVARAAILGYRFDPQMLVDVFGFSPEAVALALHRARARLLVVEVAGARVRFRFRHALTHETIANETFEYEARPLHARIAETLSAGPDAAARIAEIAYHRYRARDAERAVPANEAAAEAALAIHAYADAATLYARALDLARTPLEESRFNGRMLAVLTLCGDHALALAYGERALALELERGAYAEASVTIRRIASRLASLGREAEAHGRLAAFASEHGASLAPADALLVTGWGLLLNLGGGAPRTWRERLRAHDAAALASSSGAWGLALLEVNADADLGDLAAWTDSVRRLRRLAERASAGERAMSLLQIAVTGAYAGADRAVVRAAIDEAGACFERYGLLSLGRYLATADALDRYLRGELAAARQAVGAALAEPGDLNHIANLAVFAPALGADLEDRELLALAAHEHVARSFWAEPVTHGAALLGTCLASRALAAGRDDEARRILERAVDGLETLLGAHLLLPFAARCVVSEQARARIAELVGGVDPGDPAGLATRAMVAATFATRERRPDAARLAFEAATRYERLGWPLLRARALALAGDDATARALEAACGLVRKAREAGDRHVDDACKAADAGLTGRERAVAAAVAAGLANREIAARLNLSVKTVEAHLSRIYARLGLRSRVQLAGYVTGGEAASEADAAV